jgi:cytosine permease
MPALNTPFFIGPVNGIIVSMILYVILAKVMPQPEASYSEAA